jgi:pimeloyl-ACP methyl ester carboxylesterase
VSTKAPARRPPPSPRPPILFLHGAFGGPDIFERFLAPWFAARGHRVHVPRLPGDVERPPARIRDYVRAARRAADTMGGAPIVVAHSLGGLIAQHLAAERRLPGVALIGSPGPMGLGPSLWRLSAQRPSVLASLMLTQAGAGQLLGVQAARDALFTADTPAEWIAEVMTTPTPESPAALLDGLTWDLPLWPLGRRSPMLALLGEADAFVPRSDLTALGFTYGAETEVLTGMAHGAPIDPHWKRLAWRIDAWLEERVLPRLALA